MTPQDIAAQLPNPDRLEQTSRSLAALDAVLSPETDYRTYTYNPAWSPTARLATMNDGSGDDYVIVYSDQGTAIRGFDHESKLSPWTRDADTIAPGVLDGLPENLRFVIDDLTLHRPGSSSSEVTFCFWIPADSDRWSAGPATDDGGAAWMLNLAHDGTADAYVNYAISYFEVDLSLETVEAFFASQPATAKVIGQLNPTADVETALADLRSIGYPVAT